MIQESSTKGSKYTSEYILVTPARNEETTIERTIASVLAQSHRPKCWVIVDDGSADRTGEIASCYASKYDFIRFCHISAHDKRDFASKVHAIHAGYVLMANMESKYVGNLDADVTFDGNYFTTLLERFEADPKLGLAGGTIYEVTPQGSYPQVNNALWSVAGATQLFRREVYEAIGGYRPLPRGGEDAIAEFMVRQLGWKVRSFEDLQVFHHRLTGTAIGGVLDAKYRRGLMEYTNGNHPLWEILKCIKLLPEWPYVIGSLAWIVGFAAGYLKREPRPLPEALIEAIRAEQIGRLWAMLHRA
jgi:glycosyltransferase involved in cell wall biosynthesis